MSKSAGWSDGLALGPKTQRMDDDVASEDERPTERVGLWLFLVDSGQSGMPNNAMKARSR